MSASAALGHQRTRPPARPRIEHHLHRFRRTERLHPQHPLSGDVRLRSPHSVVRVQKSRAHFLRGLAGRKGSQ
jgi:hypothetical protein